MPRKKRDIYSPRKVRFMSIRELCQLFGIKSSAMYDRLKKYGAVDLRIPVEVISFIKWNFDNYSLDN